MKPSSAIALVSAGVMSAARADVSASPRASPVASMVLVLILVVFRALMNMRLVVLMLPFTMPLRDFVVHRTLGLCADRVDETDKKNQPRTAIHFSCMQECRLSLPEQSLEYCSHAPAWPP